MHLVSTYLPPSAASHAVKCNLGQELLVVARINRLDVLELLPSGAKPLSPLELLPRIVAVYEIPRSDGPGALLVVTDHPDCSVLIIEFSGEDKTLVVRSSHSFVSAYGRPLAGCPPCAVSTDGQHAAVALHQGTINILSFSRRADSVCIASKFECPIREILISGFCFVPFLENDDDKLALAFLHRTHRGDRELVIREIGTDENEISSDAVKIDIRDEGTDRVIPILPGQNGGGGGLLLCGGKELLYFDSQQEVSSPAKSRRVSTSGQRGPDVHIDWPYSDITGHGFVDQERLLLSDKYGKLILLTLVRTGETKRIHKMSLHKFGESSAASCIAYLNAGVVFLGSETGDSHLMRLNPTGNIDVIDTYQNVAPISDAVLADLDNSNEPAVVTCSGSGRTGSLRVIRTGANIEELASLSGVDGVRGVFTLAGVDGRHSYLLLSFHSESKLIDVTKTSQFSEISASDFPSVMRSEATLAAANISADRDEPSSLAVQVTTSAVILFDVQSGMEYAKWRGAITTADINGNFVCVALKKGKVVKLRVNTDHSRLEATAEIQFDSEVSALSIQPISSQERKPKYALFGLWEDSSLQLVPFDTLDLAGLTRIQMPHVPRSIITWTFGPSNDHTYLFVGTGNGQLISLRTGTRKTKSTTPIPNLIPSDLSGRRSTSLGDRPVYLQRCIVDNKVVIMATGARTVIMSWSNGRIAQHHVNVKGLETVTVLNSVAFPNALIFKLAHGLIIARIGRLEKLKIDSIPLGYDVPVTMAYHPDVKAFAVGCVRSEPSRGNDPDVLTSSFKLLDALTLEHLNSHTLGTNEEVTKISILDLSIGGLVQKFIVVGTAVWDEDGNEPSKGRILLFKAQMGRSKLAIANPAVPTVTLAMDTEIPGSVVALGEVAGYLAVIVNTVLIVYRVRRNENTKDMDLRPLDQWAHNYALWSLVVTSPERIVVGDSLQSITVLRWNEAKMKLEVVARDWTSLASMNVTADEEYVIQSDIDGNLLSYKVQSSLERKGHYFFGENISHLMPGSLDAIESIDPSLPVPKHLLFTPGGRISVISKCPESKAMLLHSLQRNMSTALKKEWFDVLAWRAPHSSMKRLPVVADEAPQTSGFVDGDLLARSLEIEQGLIKKVLEGNNSAERLGLEWRDIRALVEELQSMR